MYRRTAALELEGEPSSIEALGLFRRGKKEVGEQLAGEVAMA